MPVSPGLGQSRARGSAGGGRDRGARAAVTGGGHLDGFVELVRTLLVLLKAVFPALIYSLFIAFWVLLAFDWHVEAVSLKSGVTFVAVYLAGGFGLSFLATGGAWHVVLAALLDIILMFRFSAATFGCADAHGCLVLMTSCDQPKTWSDSLVVRHSTKN